jgi:Asp-tRNA(Asn)/Glu-tRNA(Gln) amidotransferase A subunit family amidase
VAGAIVIGKTHTHELAYGVNMPPTRNPWRLDAYPGGSSAGSGVSVAVRSAFGAVGTDGGGSIRCPGSVNSVIGLKPTNGLVSRRGVVPMSSTFDTVGPLARTGAARAST